MDGGLLEYFDVFLLVFARMGGMVFINPVFSRKGVPFMVRTGLVLALSMLIAPAARSGAAGMISFSTFDMAEALIREVALGVGIGYIFQIFFYMLYVAGDLLDTAFGLAMGKVMDPMNGVQTAILGQFVNVFFFLYFFATGCHLLTVKLFAYTYEVIPVGAGDFFAGKVIWYITSLFATVFLMAVKLALPFVAAEFVLEMTMGVLMKLIPQIHVFVINIQCKILLGMLLMILFAHPVGAFLDGYIDTMMREVRNVIMMMT
ncbi:flagellar biosynthetic protein FliR [Enterocloster citroniae]|uniref:flagellar biosynthetic protein FliR n=1 Tax=Enterocloster citroniae TaxID=358743 RepID=UPI0034A58752